MMAIWPFIDGWCRLFSVNLFLEQEEGSVTDKNLM
jgi:hypothetical protein